MPNASLAEIYFIVGMFVLITIISGVSTYFFFRTYRKEKVQRQQRVEKQKAKNEE